MKNHQNIPMWFVAVMFAALMMCSCGTVHKIFNKKKENIDSTSVQRSDTANKQMEDSISRHQSIEMHGSDIEVELDDTGGVKQITHSPVVERDYFVQYDTYHHTLRSNEPIKSLKFHFDDSIAMNDSTAMIRETDHHVSSYDSTHIKKKETDIVKTVDKKGMTFGASAMLIGVGVIGLVIFILFLYIRKKKKTITDVVNTAKEIL